jgi:hypothetical protein
VLVTATSALGRSSLYNRLKLAGLVEFKRIGWTQGWGHFQIPNDIFRDMRHLLELHGHPYANGHEYGKGPNWRIRTIREALGRLGIGDDLPHGVAREVFACHGTTTGGVSDGQHCEPRIERPTAQPWSLPEALGHPRATRYECYKHWSREISWCASLAS